MMLPVPSLSKGFSPVAHVNDQTENVQSYSKFGLIGTSWLGFRDIPTLIKRHVTIVSPETIDYGCGAGRSSLFLRSLGLDPLGLDISREMLAAARENDAAHATRYREIQNGIIPYADKTVDLVFSSYVFLVLNEMEMKAILREMSRSLKDDGVIIIVTYSEDAHRTDLEWLSYDTDFPENKELYSGKIVKIRNKITGTVFLDYNWFDQDYHRIFHECGLEVVEQRNPIGQLTDPYPWKAETDCSPLVQYVLKKQLCLRTQNTTL